MLLQPTLGNRLNHGATTTTAASPARQSGARLDVLHRLGSPPPPHEPRTTAADEARAFTKETTRRRCCCFSQSRTQRRGRGEEPADDGSTERVYCRRASDPGLAHDDDDPRPRRVDLVFDPLCPETHPRRARRRLVVFQRFVLADFVSRRFSLTETVARAKTTTQRRRRRRRRNGNRTGDRGGAECRLGVLDRGQETG